MATPARGHSEWKRLERARMARAREHYRRTAPGQRVEEAIELSRELTELASRGRRRG